ncbi:MAG: hypothetical protein QM765_05195 [Myxococcales bacterium]
MPLQASAAGTTAPTQAPQVPAWQVSVPKRHSPTFDGPQLRTSPSRHGGSAPASRTVRQVAVGRSHEAPWAQSASVRQRLGTRRHWPVETAQT